MQVDATPPLPEQHYPPKLFTLPQSSRPHYQQQRQLVDKTFAAAEEEKNITKTPIRPLILPTWVPNPASHPPFSHSPDLPIRESRKNDGDLMNVKNPNVCVLRTPARKKKITRQWADCRK